MKQLKIAGFIILAELLGLIGTIFTAPKIPGWYASLTKPSFSPPNWIFGPVWTLLFALMGIALYLVWQNKESPTRKIALWAFGIQFALNILWSFFFFGIESPLLGILDIALLWLAILWTIIEFRKINVTASLLLLPYLAWVSFATILNISIWLLN